MCFHPRDSYPCDADTAVTQSPNLSFFIFGYRFLQRICRNFILEADPARIYSAGGSSRKFNSGGGPTVLPCHAGI